MAQVCLGQKHFLSGQGWVDGCSPHAWPALRGSCGVCLLWSLSVWPQLPACPRVLCPLQPPDGSPSLCQVPSPQGTLLWDLTRENTICLVAWGLPTTVQQPRASHLGQTAASLVAESSLRSSWRAEGQKKLLSKLAVMVWFWQARRPGSWGEASATGTNPKTLLRQ